MVTQEKKKKLLLESWTFFFMDHLYFNDIWGGGAIIFYLTHQAKLRLGLNTVFGCNKIK